MNNKTYSFSALLSAVLLFCFCDPYFLWSAYKIDKVYLILKGILFLTFLINIDISTKGRGLLFGCFFLLLFSIPFSQENNIFGYMSSLVVCTIPFANIGYANRTYNYFLNIYTVIIALSGLVWILSLFGAAPSMGAIPPLNEMKQINYIVYPLLVIPNVVGEFPRFCGPFDEPGVVGTLSAFLLTIGKFNLRDRRILIVFLTGLFSLSFFYYFYVGVYYSVFTLFVKQKKKRALFMMFIIAIFVVFSFNSVLYEVIWRRFEWDSNKGSLAGINRINIDSQNYFNSIVGTREFFFGVKNYSAFEAMAGGGASWIMIVVHYGFVFVSIFMGIFARLGWIYKKDMISYVLFLFVVLGTIYQRPFIFEPEYLFFFSLLAVSCGDLKTDMKIKFKTTNNNEGVIRYSN